MKLFKTMCNGGEEGAKWGPGGRISQVQAKQHEEGQLEATKRHCCRPESDSVQHQQDAANKQGAGCQVCGA